jgi:hypothetical protein
MPRKGASNPIHKSVVDGTFRPQVVQDKTKPKPKTARQASAAEIKKDLISE